MSGGEKKGHIQDCLAQQAMSVEAKIVGPSKVRFSQCPLISRTLDAV